MRKNSEFPLIFAADATLLPSGLIFNLFREEDAQLIDVISMNEERPAPMSDPMSRRSPSGPIPGRQAPLFDFLCPGPSLNQSSSAPNLVNLTVSTENTSTLYEQKSITARGNVYFPVRGAQKRNLE